MEGILLVDKPVNWTSFDVVNYVRKIVAEAEGKKTKQVKVGHAGTLDPFATGLLILLIGKNYTRQASNYSKLDKTYEFEAILGKVSSTGDPEGEIKEISDKRPEVEQINKVLTGFQGQIEQAPPSYSAIKVNGVRSYKLAREGKQVTHEVRPVFIESMELISYKYPNLLLKAKVSSGTYIRTLVEDIGESLGTGAYTEKLRRLDIGDYDVNDAATTNDINTETISKLLKSNK